MENSIENEWDETIAQLDPTVEPRKMRVLDLIDISVPRADAEERASRMAICKGCDRLKLNTLCSECNCVMKFKTWLGPATCPIEKW